MQNDIDPNLKYLLLVVAALLTLSIVHGHYNMQEERFGLCEVQHSCTGVEVGDVCVGVKDNSIDCVTPENATDWQRAEAECGLLAQGICNRNPEMTGLDWTNHPNASYNGQACTAWEQNHDQFRLLTCEQTFEDVTQWQDNTGE